MDNLDFFAGQRVRTFTTDFYGGKAQLTWTVTESWEEVLGRSLNCGMERSYKLKKILGVTLVERADFEATMTAALGAKGILQAKSEVKSKLGKEVRLEDTQEEEEQFRFQAPKCGRLTLRVFQLMRVHKLSFQDHRFWLWRSEAFTKKITEWVNSLYDTSVAVEFDPACGCRDRPEKEIEGLTTLSLGNIAMLLGYFQGDDGLEFPSLNLTIPGKRIEDVLFETFTFDAATIPHHVRFIGAQAASAISGTFLPYRGELSVMSSREIPAGVTIAEREGIEARLAARREELLAQYGPRDPWKALTNRSNSKNLWFLLIGGCVGALTTLLFAPRSGSELRAEIADAAHRELDRYRDVIEQLSQGLGEVATEDWRPEFYAADELSENAAQAAWELMEGEQDGSSAATKRARKVEPVEQQKAEIPRTQKDRPKPE